MGLMSLIRQWQSGQTHRLDDLGPDEREALARDIGIPEAVLMDLIVRGPDAKLELPRLMEALSLNPEQIARMRGALMHDLSVTCSQCGDVDRCRRALNGGWAYVSFTEFCPNSETLQELRNEASLPRRGAS